MLKLLQKLNYNVFISLYGLFIRNLIVIEKISKDGFYICFIAKALFPLAWSSAFSAKVSVPKVKKTVTDPPRSSCL